MGRSFFDETKRVMHVSFSTTLTFVAHVQQFINDENCFFLEPKCIRWQKHGKTQFDIIEVSSPFFKNCPEATRDSKNCIRKCTKLCTLCVQTSRKKMFSLPCFKRRLRHENLP